jgi:hypothetical protein
MGCVDGLRRAMCNTNSPLRLRAVPVRLTNVPTHAALPRPIYRRHRTDRRHPRLPPHRLQRAARPWGWARQRQLRGDPASRHRPRRARCRTCHRTQVLVWALSYPRRPDSIETVATVLLAAARGIGHRPASATVGLPSTTVRGWIRRARVNAETVRCHATVLVHAFDPVAHPLEPTGSPLGDMLDAVGRAVTAAFCRLGPTGPPLEQALVMTRGAILAPQRPLC